MKIGEVIRKNRKEKQMTQEELAGLLGVTASAVNKWENGSSYPDIALLAPIARVFSITTDELLSYREELTELELARIVRELSQTVMSQGYEALLEAAKKALQEYPNCDRLALNVLVLLDSYRYIMGEEQPQVYEPYLAQIRTRLLKSSDSDVVQAAAENGFYSCINHEEYGEAEQILCHISKDAKNYHQMRALFYRKQGKKGEAYRIYEEAVFAGYQQISQSFAGILALAKEDSNQETVNMILEKQEQLAALFEMGRYYEIYLRLESVLAHRDKEETITFLGELVEGLKTVQDFRKSPLYAHMDFGSGTGKETFFMIKQALAGESELDFVKDEPEFLRLMQVVEELCEAAENNSKNCD